MLIKERSEMAEDVVLENVDTVGFTKVSERCSLPLSNEKLYELAQKLTEQQKEEENEEDIGTK